VRLPRPDEADLEHCDECQAVYAETEAEAEARRTRRAVTIDPPQPYPDFSD
jgi:hypothetical protein